MGEKTLDSQCDSFLCRELLCVWIIMCQCHLGVWRWVLTILPRQTTSFQIRTNFWLTSFSGGLGDSVILANDVSKITQLNNWLLPHLQSSDRSYWKLCFRASIHGWLSRTFHSYCDNKGSTVTIVRVGIYIFGGYNDNSWQSKSVK